MNKTLKLSLILVALLETSCAINPVIEEIPSAQQQRLNADMQSVKRYRDGVARLINYAKSRVEIFPSARPNVNYLLTESERETVRHLWASLLDYYLLLDSIQRYHLDGYVLPISQQQKQSFQIAHSAFLTQYRFALEFIERVENDPNLAVLLNDAIPESGLAANSYDNFKLRFLNAKIATEFAAYDVIEKTVFDKQALLVPAITEDTAYLWNMGKGKGVELTLNNAGSLIKNKGLQLIFPIQAGVSEWMGDTKVLRQDKSLISATQIQDLEKQLEPGDIMLQRREWYVSNVGLPGFWSHSALYIGTAEQRLAYFNDAEVKHWVIAQGEPTGDFEALLRKDSAIRYGTSLAPQEHGHKPRVLEAISEGVAFTSIEHSAAADALVSLRPRLSKLEKAKALRRAFRYSGRPYDFNFDFQTDSALVCTELIYKAYEPDSNYRGIRLNLEDIAGRTVMPANAIAKQFDQEYGTDQQQFDLIVFLDGQEKKGIAVQQNVDAFRQSWKRPKWHALL